MISYLRSVAKLVSVSRDTSDASHCEVKWLQSYPQLVGEDYKEAPEAGVYMNRNVELTTEGGDVTDGIHDAVSVLRGRGQQHDGV